MATFALTDVYLSIGGTDVSDWVASVTLETSADALDDTAMGDTYRSRIGGLKDTSWTITFHQDYAGSAIDSVINGVGIGAAATIVAKPTSAAVGATNPTYTQSVLITQYPMISGGVGDLAQVSVTWPGAGTLTRATA